MSPSDLEAFKKKVSLTPFPRLRGVKIGGKVFWRLLGTLTTPLFLLPTTISTHHSLAGEKCLPSREDSFENHTTTATSPWPVKKLVKKKKKSGPTKQRSRFFCTPSSTSRGNLPAIFFAKATFSTLNHFFLMEHRESLESTSIFQPYPKVENCRESAKLVTW